MQSCFFSVEKKVSVEGSSFHCRFKLHPGCSSLSYGEPKLTEVNAYGKRVCNAGAVWGERIQISEYKTFKQG